MKTKIFTLLLAIAAGIGSMFASNTEVNGIWYNFNSNTKTAIVTFRGSYSSEYTNVYSGDVVITESVTYNGITYSVTSIGSTAFYGCTGLTSVTIGNSVTSIGDYAFKGCSSLISVEIPNSVTSIGEEAFSYCTDLTSVTIGNSVTSIGTYAFVGCTSLTKVNITDIAAWCNIAFSAISGNPSSNPLYYAKHLYVNDEEVTELVIPNSVTSIGSYAFYNCSGLTSVTIPESVASIGYYAFYNCSGLTSVTIGNSVTNIRDYAFYNCRSLISVTIPNSVTSIGEYAFYAVPNIVYSGRAAGSPWGAISVNGYVDGYLVYSNQSKNTLLACFRSAQGEIVIPNSVTSIRSQAFDGCSGLTSVTIPESVTSIGNRAFDGCSGLTKVNIMDIAAWCNIAFSSGSNPLYYAKHLYVNDEEVTELVIPNSVTSIGSYAFYNCSGLTSVTIPNSVTSIGNQAFWDCTSLTSVTIPNSVTSIGDYAFVGCSSLTSVTIGNSVTSIGASAFSYCSGLTSVTIPNSVTSIGEAAFHSCTGLTSVTIPNSVTSIGEAAFRDCSSLTSVTIGNSVTSIGSRAFSGCSGLTSVTIPNSVTSIGSYAFYAVPNIVYSGRATGSPWGALSVNGYVDGYLVYSDESKTTLLACSTSAQGKITIPNSVTSIGEYAFYGCSGLTSVTIPNSVTSIGSRAFSGCSGLTSVTIPNSVTSIGSYAFYAVPNIVYSGRATGSPWGALSVNGYVDGYLVYSDESKTTLLACFRSAQGEIIIPNSVTSIENRAFSDCSGLTSVTIPESVTSIGTYAFVGCTSLTKVNITDLTAWCNIAFSGSSSNPLYYAKHLYVNDVEVTDLVIPESVTSIGSYAFYRCTSLTSVTIPESVTSIGSYAFYECAGLTSVTIPNSVTSIGGSAFSGCSGLTSVTIPNSVTSIGGSAFSGCTSLNSIVWNAKNCPDFAPNNTPFYANYYNNSNHIYFDLRPQITSFTFGSDVEHIPANLLEGMSNLPFINLSNTLAWAEQNFTETNTPLNTAKLYLNGQEIKKLTISDGVTSIGAYTFINCAKMTELTIPSSVTTIGEGAFMNENRLQKITLGENIETIANSAFTNCPYLLEIHARMEFPPVIDASVFADCGDLSGIDCYIPEDSYAFYKKTAVWKEFNLIAEQEPEPTAINPVSDDKPAQMNKILRNGQIFILRGDKIYTLTGQEVK